MVLSVEPNNVVISARGGAGSLASVRLLTLASWPVAEHWVANLVNLAKLRIGLDGNGGLIARCGAGCCLAAASRLAKVGNAKLARARFESLFS